MPASRSGTLFRKQERKRERKCFVSNHLFGGLFWSELFSNASASDSVCACFVGQFNLPLIRLDFKQIPTFLKSRPSFRTAKLCPRSKRHGLSSSPGLAVSTFRNASFLDALSMSTSDPQAKVLRKSHENSTGIGSKSIELISVILNWPQRSHV